MQQTILLITTQPLRQKLWTESGPETVSVFEASDLDEAQFMISEIKKSMLTYGIQYKDIAILYRSNAQSRVIEDVLNRNAIPYRVYGGLRFFDRLEIKDMLGYFRLIYNQDDDAAFERIINTPPRGIGNMAVNLVRDQASSQGISLWAAAQLGLDRNAYPNPCHICPWQICA